MATIYANHVGGVVDDNPLTSGATTLNSSALADLPTVAAPDTMWIVLDPEAVSGDPEIVQVTAHSSAATDATIVRAQQSTTARAHTQNTAWVVAFTKTDADELPFRKVTTKGDILAASAANTVTRLAAGTNGLPLVAKSSEATGLVYEALAAGALASNAVTTAKILDSNVTTAKIADLNVTTAKIADSNVTLAKMADGSVDTAELVDAAVTTAKVEDEAVTTAKLHPNARRGMVAFKAKEDGTQTGITTSTVITDLDAQFTADADVAYKVTVDIPVIDLVPGTDETVFVALRGGTSGAGGEATGFRQKAVEISSGGQAGIQVMYFAEAGVLSGVTDFLVRIAPAGGNEVNVLAANSYDLPTLLVEAAGE